MKPWINIKKEDLQEADHIKKSYTAVKLAKREDKAYSDEAWSNIQKQQTALLNGEWLDKWREYLQDQSLSKAEKALEAAEKLSKAQTEIGLQMYPQSSLNYRKDVLRDAILKAT